MTNPAAGVAAAGLGRRVLIVAVVLSALALFTLPRCLDDSVLARSAGPVVGSTDPVEVAPTGPADVDAITLDACPDFSPVAVPASKAGAALVSLAATADRTPTAAYRCVLALLSPLDGTDLHRLGSLRI